MSAPFRKNSRVFPENPLILYAIPVIILPAILITACQAAPPPNHQVSGTPFEIIFVGDLLLGDAAQPLLEEHGYMWPFLAIEHMIEGDYAIANGEAPFTVLDHPWDPGQRWSYNAQPEAAQALAELGFDAVGLSNNHAMDRGPQGVADTIAHLQSNHLEFFGAGLNEAQAEAPLLIETPYGLVGVVALSDDWGNDRTAAEDHAGTIPLSKASIRRGYQLAKDAGADWVVGYVHWGRNYAHITRGQHSWARHFARAGYDLVVGHGAHSIQPIEVVNGMPVVYSVGNFVFGTPGRFTEKFPGFGLVVSAELHPEGFNSLAIRCIQTDNRFVNFQPLPCTPAQAQQVFNSLYEGLIIESDTAALRW